MCKEYFELLDLSYLEVNVIMTGKARMITTRKCYPLTHHCNCFPSSSEARTNCAAHYSGGAASFGNCCCLLQGQSD